MDEEMEKEDNIDIFNANFLIDGSEEQILDLYNMNKKVENNDIISKKIIKRIYNHPLFLNYNYCLFCLERRKTKYNDRNLYDKHKSSNLKKITDFLRKKNIKLKYSENKIANRRYIHSCEHIEKVKVNNNQNSESDTELYIDENENITPIKKNSKMSSKLISKSIALDISFDSHNSNNLKFSKNNSNKIKLSKTEHTKSLYKQPSIEKVKKRSSQNSLDKKENVIFKRRNRNLKSTKKKISLYHFLGL